eukprot:scaffold138746_cov34-Prasinocladus_malaysianus.AAC.1
MSGEVEAARRVCLLLPVEGSSDVVEYAKSNFLTTGTVVMLLTVVRCGPSRRKSTAERKAEKQEEVTPAQEQLPGTVQVK